MKQQHHAERATQTGQSQSCGGYLCRTQFCLKGENMRGRKLEVQKKKNYKKFQCQFAEKHQMRKARPSEQTRLGGGSSWTHHLEDKAWRWYHHAVGKRLFGRESVSNVMGRRMNFRQILWREPASVSRGIVIRTRFSIRSFLSRLSPSLSVSPSASWRGSWPPGLAAHASVSVRRFPYSRGRGHHCRRVQDLQGLHPGAWRERNLQSQCLPGPPGASRQVTMSRCHTLHSCSAHFIHAPPPPLTVLTTRELSILFSITLSLMMVSKLSAVLETNRLNFNRLGLT